MAKEKTGLDATVRFVFEKETKGTAKYEEVDADGKPSFAPVSGTLYIRKHAMPGGKIPQALSVTIKEVA